VGADKYALVTIIIDDVELLPFEVVLIVDKFVGEIRIEGRKVRLPGLIIGSGTMDRYGIILDYSLIRVLGIF